MHRAVWIVLITVGCKGQDKAPSPAGSASGSARGGSAVPAPAKDTCALLTADEIRAVVGHPVTPESAGDTECQYTGQSPDQYRISVTYYRASDMYTCDVV